MTGRTICTACQKVVKYTDYKIQAYQAAVNPQQFCDCWLKKAPTATPRPYQ